MKALLLYCVCASALIFITNDDDMIGDGYVLVEMNQCLQIRCTADQKQLTIYPN